MTQSEWQKGTAISLKTTVTNGDNRGGGGGDDAKPWPFWESTALAAALPKWSMGCFRAILGVTIALYIMNQKHLLPKQISAVVSKTLFWPSLPITVASRFGRWSTVIDDTVIMGAAPFGFAHIPEVLYEKYGVRGVINLCQEYRGPEKSYKRLGIKELWLPTVDHFEPSVQDLRRAVNFIRSYEVQGKKVYVHCRAGHGRSAATVFAWLLSKDPTVDRKKLNEELCKIRDVRKTLWKQPNIMEFHSYYKTDADDGDADV